MYRTLFGFVLTFLLSGSLFGQLLWRVEGAGLAQPSYLFGTFHLTCRDQFQVDDSLSRVLQEVDGLILEINLRDPGLLTDYIQSSRLPAGVTLTQGWPEAKRDSFRLALKKSFQLDLSNFETLQPMVLISSLYPKILQCPTASYELYLMEQAQKRGIQVIGLEKASDQLKAMARIPLDKQMASLVEMVQDPVQSKKEFDELWNLYQTKQVDALFEKTSQDPQLGEFQEFLLDDRNRLWVQQLPQLMQESSRLIAVGAGHLGGAQGLLHLLKEAGYTLKPVF